MRPMPENDRAVPSHACREKASPSRTYARMAVMMGLVLMMKLAAPAEMLVSPKFSRVV